MRPSAPPPEGRDERLWEVSLKFEALFLQQMLAAMRRTVPESGFLPRGFADTTYEAMMDQAVADAGGRRGELGIAAAIYAQLRAAGAGGGEEAARVASEADAQLAERLRTVALDRYRDAMVRR